MKQNEVTSEQLRAWAKWFSGGARPGWSDLRGVAAYLRAEADRLDAKPVDHAPEALRCDARAYEAIAAAKRTDGDYLGAGEYTDQARALYVEADETEQRRAARREQNNSTPDDGLREAIARMGKIVNVRQCHRCRKKLGPCLTPSWCVGYSFPAIDDLRLILKAAERGLETL